jgi:ubiquinone biosynthesis protein
LRGYRKIRRYEQIVATVAKYGFSDLLSRTRRQGRVGRRRGPEPERRLFRIRGTSLGDRLRLMLEELGPTFVKLGQILSLRPDLLPEEITAELRKLQDRVAPVPGEQIHGIMREELGARTSELFREFEFQPIAAASLAQVHRAVTADGEEVAVKIQRPGIRRKIDVDLEILLDLAALVARYSAPLRLYHPVRLAEEFGKTIHMEVDFSHEARNLELFREKFKDDPTVNIPRVLRRLTTPRILTMEYIHGVKLTEMEGLEPAGLDREGLARNTANMILRQLFDFGFFHADPHPGNIIAQPGNVLALLDFGMIGFVDDVLRDNLSDALGAFVRRDTDKMIRALTDMNIIEDEVDLVALRHDLQNLILFYYNIPLGEVNVGAIIRELHVIIRSYRLSFPVDFALMTKAVITAESVGQSLDPAFQIAPLAEPFIRRTLLSKLSPQRNFEIAADSFGQAMELLKGMPFELRYILRKLRLGELRILFEHRGLDRLITEGDRSVNRLSFSIVTAALAIGSSLFMVLNVGPRLFGLSAIGLFGFLLAGTAGLWLLIAIIRSGRL